jgi:hypothetical protein
MQKSPILESPIQSKKEAVRWERTIEPPFAPIRGVGDGEKSIIVFTNTLQSGAWLRRSYRPEINL